MIFSADMIPRVLDGSKTVTRRPVKRAPASVDGVRRILQCTYEPGRTYAVQEARGGYAIARIRIESVMRETIVFPISWTEAGLEGFKTPGMFEAKWLDLYGEACPLDVWRIQFTLQ